MLWGPRAQVEEEDGQVKISMYGVVSRVQALLGLPIDIILACTLYRVLERLHANLALLASCSLFTFGLSQRLGRAFGTDFIRLDPGQQQFHRRYRSWSSSWRFDGAYPPDLAIVCKPCQDTFLGLKFSSLQVRLVSVEEGWDVLLKQFPPNDWLFPERLTPEHAELARQLTQQWSEQWRVPALIQA